MTRDKLRPLKNRDSNRRKWPITTVDGIYRPDSLEFTIAMSQCEFFALPALQPCY